MYQHQYRKSYEVIGYTYEADVHCLDCTRKRFGSDEHEYANVADNEGNPIHPIFLGDEREEHEYCGDCWEEIE